MVGRSTCRFFRQSNRACVPAHLARLHFTTPSPGPAVEPQGRKRDSGILKTNAAPSRSITPPQSATRQRFEMPWEISEVHLPTRDQRSHGQVEPVLCMVDRG